jgi:hypothetical protein
MARLCSSIPSVRFNRAPFFAMVAILSLGLGIGSASGGFFAGEFGSVEGLPHRQRDRLVVIREIVTPLTNTYPSLPVMHHRT